MSFQPGNQFIQESAQSVTSHFGTMFIGLQATLYNSALAIHAKFVDIDTVDGFKFIAQVFHVLLIGFVDFVTCRLYERIKCKVRYFFHRAFSLFYGHHIT